MSNAIKDFCKELLSKTLKEYDIRKVKPINDRIDNIISNPGDGSTPTEVIDARLDASGVVHATLKKRLDSDSKGPVIAQEVAGEYITVNDCVEGPITDIEILGKTVQGTDLADIQSVGTATEDGRFKMSILSTNEYLKFTYEEGSINLSTGQDSSSTSTYRTSYVECIPNNDYMLNFNVFVILYDSNKKYIKSVNGNNPVDMNTYFNVGNARFIRFYRGKTDFEKVELTSKQYQSNKSSILLPVQLGNGDRLYWCDVEKAWCVDKVETKLIVDDSTVITNSSSFASEGFTVVQIQANNIPGRKYKSICSHLVWKDNLNDAEEGLSHWSTTNNIVAKVSNSKLTEPNVRGVKKYLIDNGVWFKYCSAEVTKIILPQDQQIALNSFFGTTHIFTEDTIIEPTFKAKVSKSIGATVSSLSNKTDILEDRLELVEGLQDSANFEYYTKKGHVVAENTNNGQIDGLKLEGRTLVNLGVGEIIVPKNTAWVTVSKDFIFPNTEYTIICSIDKAISQGLALINCGTTNEIAVAIPAGKTQGVVKFTSTQFAMFKAGISVPSDSDCLLKVIILEGDHTQAPPSYFEGLKSVGEDVDRIEVLTSNNLSAEIDSVDEKGNKIKIPNPNYKEHKKRILYYNDANELVPVLCLREWDKVENGKYTVGSGQVVLNGSENFLITGTPTDTHISFKLNLGAKRSSAPICDKFKVGDSANWRNEEYVYIDSSSPSLLCITILKSKLETLDVAGFKKWLQANNVTVVYQLATPKTYETINLDLNSYANETLVLCNAGSINPKMSFEITSHIGNTVNVLRDRVSYLEGHVVTQNRLQLASTYNADSVAFKVDFNNRQLSETGSYDIDLYNLIKDNIIIGKDNYSYDKMSTMLIDYASWSQISWEQYDELMLIMDLQNNPPINGDNI